MLQRVGVVNLADTSVTSTRNLIIFIVRKGVPRTVYVVLKTNSQATTIVGICLHTLRKRCVDHSTGIPVSVNWLWYMSTPSLHRTH